MYIPTHNQMENPDEIRQFIKENDFGILVSTNQKQEIFATHIPFILTKNQKGEEVLRAHIAKANPQWKNFSNENFTQNKVLAIFSGAHSYISPSWYDHRNVPTWNYLAVQVEGFLRLVEGEELYEHLTELMNFHEKFQENPQSITDIPEKILKPDLRGVVGFEILITDIHAKAKLSQNRDAHNQQRIITQLEKQENPNASQIAEKMKEIMNDKL